EDGKAWWRRTRRRPTSAARAQVAQSGTTPAPRGRARLGALGEIEVPTITRWCKFVPLAVRPVPSYITRPAGELMDRRTFLGTLRGRPLAAPVFVEAQQARNVYSGGYLSSSATIFEPFRHALRELGYTEDQNLLIEARLAAGKIERLLALPPELGLTKSQNLLIEARLAAGKIDRLPALAVELVRARVDVIAAVSPPAIEAAKGATTAIPIVMAFISVDPVQSGFVDSLGRPGWQHHRRGDDRRRHRRKAACLYHKNCAPLA